MSNHDHKLDLMRWVASLIVEQDLEPTWVATHSKPFVKDSRSFSAKYWWAIIRSSIWLTLVDNNLMLEHPVLVANILVGYKIDWDLPYYRANPRGDPEEVYLHPLSMFDL